MAGSLKTGDNIELLPGRREVKLRGIQSHGHNVNEIHLGDRVALNISNLSHRDLSRGEQIATPGYIATPRSVAVEFELLPETNPLPFNYPVRVNAGTAEVIARVKPVNTTNLQPGSNSPAVLELQERIPVVIGDKIIVRSFSPITTIGGGKIIDVTLPKRWRDQRVWTLRLCNKSITDNIYAVIESHGSKPITVSELARRLGRSEHSTGLYLTDAILRVGDTADPWLITIGQADSISHNVLEVVKDYHQTYPYKQGVNREYIRQRTGGNEKFLEIWLKEMVTKNLLAARGNRWSMPGFSVVLSQSDQDALDRFISTVEEQSFETDYIDVLAENLEIAEARLKTIIAFAESQGYIIRLTSRIVIHRNAMDHFLGMVHQHFLEKQELTIADVKNMTGTTRKYTMPLMEYLDKKGLTIRIGDKRIRPDG
jgi:selenocysteine-specific elongation factor